MSIIYDALKKVEQKVVNAATAGLKPQPDKKSKLAPKVILLYVVCVSAGLLIANLAFSFFTRPAKGDAGLKTKAKLQSAGASTLKPLSPVTAMPSAASTVPSPLPAPNTALTPVPEEGQDFPPLVLNGVFSASDGGYALINNQIVVQGDTIDGVKVVRISEDEVEVEKNGVTVKLSSQGR